MRGKGKGKGGGQLCVQDSLIKLDCSCSDQQNTVAASMWIAYRQAAELFYFGARQNKRNNSFEVYNSAQLMLLWGQVEQQSFPHCRAAQMILFWRSQAPPWERKGLTGVTGATGIS